MFYFTFIIFRRSMQPGQVYLWKLGDSTANLSIVSSWLLSIKDTVVRIPKGFLSTYTGFKLWLFWWASFHIHSIYIAVNVMELLCGCTRNITVICDVILHCFICLLLVPLLCGCTQKIHVIINLANDTVLLM